MMKFIDAISRDFASLTSMAVSNVSSNSSLMIESIVETLN